MTDALEVNSQDNVVHIKASGKLTKEMYEKFVPVIEQQIQAHGKLRLLVELIDFHGWTASALWQDVKFDMKHFSDIERLALVGDSKWEDGMATFCKPFTSAEVKYFDKADWDNAQHWLMQS